MGTLKHLLFFTSMVKYLVIKSVFCGDSASEWSYSDISDWRNKMPQCGGTRQSPVDINDNEAITVKKHTELHFDNYNTSINVVLKNNGKTVKINPISPHNITVEGQGIYLQGKFMLEEVHFHWGNTTNSGSEHKVNGKSSSMEVHLVHHNLKYLDFKTARNKHDGILVLSVLVDVSTHSSFNSFWKDLVYQLGVVKNPDTVTKYGGVWFQHFLPNNAQDFYSYQGSFTTPPCLETVTWVVFKDKLLIPEEYLMYFTDLQTTINKTQKERITSNIRPVQPLNSRTVLKTFNSTGPQQLGVQIHTTESIVGDNKVIVFFKFYDQCHLPLSASISLIIPSLGISWKRFNFTTDLEKIEPLDPKYKYGITLEMHNHPSGKYKDNIHVTVKLTDSSKHHPVTIDNKFKMDNKCFDKSCSWLTSGIKRTCTRQLIDTGDTLSFTLTLQDSCNDLYNLVIEKQNHVIFNTTISPHMRVHLRPVGVDKALNITLSKWYLMLYVEKASDHSNNAKLFFSMLYSVINYKTFVMGGNFRDNFPVVKCAKRVLAQSGAIAEHVKLIVGIGVGVFILSMIVLAFALLWKRYRANTKPTLLSPETEEDTVV